MSKSLMYEEKRADDFHEVISSNSGFFSRWGLLVILLIVLVIVSLSFVIRYPEVITASGSMLAENAPKEIICYNGGKLEKLFISNDKEVHEGQVIAWIESSTDHSQALRLLKLLDSVHLLLAADHRYNIDFVKRSTFTDLGTLQQGFQEFYSSMEQFVDYSGRGYFSKKRQSLYKDLDQLEKMQTNLESQKELLAKDNDLAKESLEMNRRLFEAKVISNEDLRREESKFIAKNLALSQISEQILLYKSRQADKLKEIDELDHSFSKQYSIFSQELLKYRNSIREWVKNFVVVAPTAGKAVFLTPLQENEYLTAMRVLGYVMPDNTKYYAQVYLPQSNFGKISLGQTVRLRLDAFPFEQYGQLDGRIFYISKIPSDTGFLANIELKGNMFSGQENAIMFKTGMKVKGLVIVKDMLLIERIFYKLKRSTNARS